jgi:protein TonB
MAALPSGARAADAEGCADLKLFPRLEGCVIVECSAKQHDDSLDSGDSTNSLAYSCPVALDLQRAKRDFETQLRKAGYLKADSGSSELTARKGPQSIRWSSSSEDGATTYSIAAASGSGEKFKAEACAEPSVLSPLKGCEVVECTSKAEDSVAMQTARGEQTSLTGTVQTVTLACPALNPTQAFSTVEAELKRSGFEILFSDRQHPESGWLTGRAGKRWAELVSAPDGESVSYALTLVPAAEVLAAVKEVSAAVSAAVKPEPLPALIPVPEPAPKPEPKPEPAPVLAAATQLVAPPVPSVPLATAPAPGPPPIAVFISPQPIVRVQIEPTRERINSVAGHVVINMLVDVSEDGFVTKAVLTGKITKDVLTLQSAALEALSQWRFQPARQDGHIVAAVKIPVQLHFHGRPWRF